MQSQIIKILLTTSIQMKLKIYPTIGIARIGNGESFYLCPETELSNGIEFDQAGKEIEVQNFKGPNQQVKKQGARFKIFTQSNDGQYKPFKLPANAVVTWSVRLVNKKAATNRTDGAIMYRNGEPPLVPPKYIPMQANARDLTIDSGEVSVAGVTTFQNRKILSGKFKFKNEAVKTVELGATFTDANQNLIVLGGHGKAEGSIPITNFYTNESWYDDTSDGYVKAKVFLPDSNETIEVEGAWLIVAPTDFAPSIKGVVTLYDQALQVAVKSFGYSRIHPLSYKYNVLPLLERFQKLFWVENDSAFILEEEYSFEALADNSMAASQDRKDVYELVRDIPLDGHRGNDQTVADGFLYTETQLEILQQWVDGKLKNDFNEPLKIDETTGDYLNKVVLDTTVGQGFYPGIEGGIILTDKRIYASPFTIDQTKVEPGDITALMALPWQADFLECENDWWPSQRPYKVLVKANDIKDWQRPMGNNSRTDGQNLIKNIHRLAFIKAKQNGAGVTYVEDERDPSLKTKTDLIH